METYSHMGFECNNVMRIIFQGTKALVESVENRLSHPDIRAQELFAPLPEDCPTLLLGPQSLARLLVASEVQL